MGPSLLLPHGPVWHTRAMLNRRTAMIAAAATLAAPGDAGAQDSFSNFVAGVKAEARRAGISDATLTSALAGVGPNQRVIELDRRQPEFHLTWPEYRARVLPPARIQAAKDNYAREQALLARVEAQYGVDARVDEPGDLGRWRAAWGVDQAATTSWSRR